MRYWTGKAYRGNVPPSYPRGATVGDVIRYEEQIGNRYEIDGGMRALMDKVPAAAATWVTKTRQAAARYSNDDISAVQEVTFGPNAVIILEDGDNGYLVLNDIAWTRR